MKKKTLIIVCSAIIIAIICSLLNWNSLISSDSATDNTEDISSAPVGPSFDADSAYAYCKTQCDFGPRVMNSSAHDQCEQYIISKFKAFGMTVTPQKATLAGYDGTKLASTNIIASYKPELTTRILICAHWDSRPWADNDPDKKNHKKPII